MNKKTILLLAVPLVFANCSGKRSGAVPNKIEVAFAPVLSDDSDASSEAEEISFLTVIYRMDVAQENRCLQKGLDLSYRKGDCDATYLDFILELDDGPRKEEFIVFFFSFDYVREYFAKDERTLFSIIWCWTEKSPSYIQMIYGEDFKAPDDLPVLHWGITKLDAIQFFISKGADPSKYFYGKEYWGTALDYAMGARAVFEKPAVDGSAYDEQDKENLDMIISYLKGI